MKKLFKLLLAAVVLLVVVVVVGSLVLRFYFSDERLRGLVLPPVEAALGRQVDFKSCSIDLISGVKLSGLVVKEADGKADFVTIDSLNLGYSLAPLLQKRLEISSLGITGLTVAVYRDRQGVFNYQSLKFLAPGSKTKTTRYLALPAIRRAGVGAPAAPPDSGLPLAIVLQHCRLSGARVTFHDALKELPDFNLRADFNGRFDFSRGLKPENFIGDGKLDFSLDLLYRGLAPKAGGEIKFDARRVDYRVKTRLKEQECTLSGSLENYLGKRLSLVCNLDSPKLDLAYLAGLADQLGGGREKTAARPPAGDAGAPPSGSAPVLTASGKVRIGEAVYEHWQVKNFALDYDFRDQVLKIADLKGELAGGHFAGNSEFKSFPADLDFSGNFSFADLGVEKLFEMAAPGTPRQLDGRLHGTFKFSGRGKQVEVLKKNLTLVGDYGLGQVELKSTPLARELATSLGLPELNNLTLDRLDGNLRLIKGRLHLDNRWSGRLLKGEAAGTVGLDGRLDLPISLVFNRQLSTRLVHKYAWLEGSLNDQGEATLNLYLNGSVNDPEVRLDRGKLQQQIGKTVQKKLEKQLFRKLNPGAAPEGEKGAAGGSAAKGGKEKPENLLRQLLN